MANPYGDTDVWVELHPVSGGQNLGSTTGNVVMQNGQMRRS